jgi:hypothetical protein
MQADPTRATEPSLAATPQVCLTLLLPVALEDRAVDWLLAHGERQVEFSVHPVAARGPLVHLALGEERVQGHARRIELKLILGRQDLEPLLGELTALLDGVDGGYWVLPVERFAAFGKAAAQSGAQA